ncbi:ClC family H(+)/Cl(-) exchange transporter [Sporanaerobium hydrogeniformans]|uniref:ClC family H(+)/Cl(-) exchange transporter n=1 Tax=Sporanaerobium hydrogeniformans TaxID=3072179 RepID=A0AC61DCK6_9FIRM|nr:ClC family H(+)/Cl(-) exchange transporter [Sporanaerobium hydrogeniformans]PHV70478.1 ClC family H(+)/Cl(-) exchange transporter [Sporanaerobium hydrogeniformans]
MQNNYNMLTDSDKMNIPLLLKSICVGICTAIVVILYRMTLTYAEQLAFGIYDFFRENIIAIPFLFIGLCIVGYVVGYLVSKNKMISGSGIPQLKGQLMGYLKNDWLHTLWAKFMGGTLGIISGLSLGREGPSIQLGACVAEGIGKKLGQNRLERKILMVSGASAGLAAAFNAPLAGVLFALEEVFKYFSPIILLSTMSSAIIADFISKQVFGMEAIFQFDIQGSIPLQDYWMLILLGILLGIMGVLYNSILLKSQELYRKINFLNSRVKLIIPFIGAGLLGLTFPAVLGGGHHMIEYFNLSSGIFFLFALFVIKFLFSMVSFGSGAPGGIFFPLLILGATLGSIFASISVHYFGYNETLFYNFVIVAMAGYFTAIVRAPITGIVLILEMTGSFSHLLSLTVVSLTAYVVADLLKSQPIYESLLDNLLKASNHEELEEEHSKKIMIELLVQYGAALEGKQVKELKWPSKCLLVSIKRGDKEILPKGDTQIKAGDYLLVLTDINSEWKTRKKLEKMNTLS